MKKNIKILLLLINLGLIFVSNVQALEIVWPSSPGGAQFNDTTTLPQMVRYFYEWGVALGGLAVFITLILAGFQYLTSMGNPAAITDAKDRISSAILGLMLLLSSFLVLNTINPELTTLKIPPLNPPSQTLGQEKFSFNISACEKAILYDQASYGGNSFELQTTAGCQSLGGTSIKGVVKSVEIKGGCTLYIFPSTGCKTDPTVLVASVDNIQAIYGTINYGSATLQVGAQEPSQTCWDVCNDACHVSTGFDAISAACRDTVCGILETHQSTGDEWCEIKENKELCCCSCQE